MTAFPAPIEIIDPRFARLVHPMARLEQLATGFTWTEGPVWFADHQCLLFSDIPSQRILRWSDSDGLGLFRADSSFANGHTRDRQGRLVSCRHGTRDMVRTEPDGSLTVLASSYNGKRLNSPNDVVVSSDGAIWFTDPTYGIISNFEGYRAEPEQNASHVFRIDPVTGRLAPVISDFVQPNGLCFSADERWLYVAESGSSHDDAVPAVIRKFEMQGAAPKDAGVFAAIDNGLPDGIRTDVEGNLWSSAADGIHCFDAQGTLLGKIHVPEKVSNLCFGGTDGHRLFITGTTSLYRIFVDVQGAERWTRHNMT
ncbi:SMP-30/gluconolactonase/LRE family protein [Salinicola peritrichatus]|uniref:SMP-30/gluconolactonase/LRE family protein n=1 Tax=Salinicola peritrichatus TaxID=1267424 RepID=UPI000DA1FCDC|nr:SMP-30/gluconolactonase/LRE family protein [Salinicola peritrichatus]